MATLASVLSPALLAQVRSVWYAHVSEGDAVILPDQDHMKAWFMGGPDFDNVCM